MSSFAGAPPRRALALRVALAFVLAATGPGCRRPPPPKVTLADVERCERGVDRAVGAPTRQEGLGIYYAECAGAYPECRDTLERAAGAPDADRLGIVLEGCRLAYCPLLPDPAELAACRPGYVPAPRDLERDFAPLNDAMLAHSAKGYTPRLAKAMLRVYQRTLSW